MAERYRYAAFISYSSKDAAFARRLHRALESFRIPSALGVFEITDARKMRNRLFPCFRDREELASGDLGGEIERALHNSGSLIVVCSPDAAKSQWVNTEIANFRRLGRDKRIFAVIAGGNTESDPGATPETLCFPPELRRDAISGGLEVVAGDARKGKDGFRNAVLKVVAGIISVTLGALADRDRAARRERAIGLAIPGLIALGLIVWAPFEYDAYQQNVRLSTAAVRLAESGDETASILAYAALAPPRPWFFVDNRLARSVLSDWGDDRQLSPEEVRQLTGITDPTKLHPLHSSLSGGDPLASSQAATDACPPELATGLSCDAIFHGKDGALVLASSPEQVLTLQSIRAGKSETLFSATAVEIQAIGAAPLSGPAPAPPAKAAAQPAAPLTTNPKLTANAYSDLFSAPAAGAATELPYVYLSAWSASGDALAWISDNRIFFLQQRDGRYALQAARLADSSPQAIVWLGPSTWLASGDAAAYQIATGGAAPVVMALPQPWLRTDTLIAYSQKHGIALIANRKGSSLARWSGGQFQEIGRLDDAAAGVAISPDEDWIASYAFGRATVLRTADGGEAMNFRIRGSPGSEIGYLTPAGRTLFVITDLDRHGTGVYALDQQPSDGTALRARVCGLLASDTEQRALQLRQVATIITRDAQLYRPDVCGTSERNGR